MEEVIARLLTNENERCTYHDLVHLYVLYCITYGCTFVCFVLYHVRLYICMFCIVSRTAVDLNQLNV